MMTSRTFWMLATHAQLDQLYQNLKKKIDWLDDLHFRKQTDFGLIITTQTFIVKYIIFHAVFFMHYFKKMMKFSIDFCQTSALFKLYTS